MPKSTHLKCYFECEIDGPLHHFPYEYPHTEKFNQWKLILNTATQERGNNYIQNNIRICHRHFEDYYKTPSRRLTRNAIPTLNLLLQTGKRTRPNTNDNEEIARKVKKLNQKLTRAPHRHKDRRRRFSSSSSSSSSSARQSSPPIQEPLCIEDDSSYVSEGGVPVASTSAATESRPIVIAGVDALLTTSNAGLTAESSTELELDRDLLKILGVDPSQQRLYGKDIQPDLAIRLQHVATSGLNKEARKGLVDRHLVPGNCTLVDAPTLNPEIKAAIPEAVFKRDKAIEQRQKQLSSVASCLGEAISTLMAQPVKDTALIQLLMDGSILLCDAQHADSLTRRNFILNNLKKELKDQLTATNIDKHLFSEELTNAFKTAKAISKSSAGIKQTTKIQAKSLRNQ